MRYMLNKLNIFVLLLLCLTHPVNAQNKHKDNRENEAPKWAIYHRSFKTTEATAYLSNKQIPAEKGLFVEGEGKSLFLALQDSMVNISDLISNYVVTYTKEDTVTTINQIQYSNPEFSSLCKIIDTYENNDGSYYVLMFLSDEDKKQILNGIYKSEMQFEIVLRQTGNKIEQIITYTYSSGD